MSRLPAALDKPYTISITDVNPVTYHEGICLTGHSNSTDSSRVLMIRANSANIYAGKCPDVDGFSGVLVLHGNLYAVVDLPFGSVLQQTKVSKGIYVSEGELILTHPPEISGAFQAALIAEKGSVVHLRDSMYSHGYGDLGMLAVNGSQIMFEHQQNSTPTVRNDPIAGTATYRLAKLVGGKATLATTSDTDVPLFICGSNCGTVGRSALVTAGRVSCTTDESGAKKDDYLVASTSVAGTCHDAGPTPPVSGWIVGQAIDDAAGNAAANVKIVATYTFSSTNGGSAISAYQYGMLTDGSAYPMSLQVIGQHGECIGGAFHSLTPGGVGGWNTCINRVPGSTIAVAATDFADVSGANPMTISNYNLGFTCNSGSYIEWTQSVTYNNVATHVLCVNSFNLGAAPPDYSAILQETLGRGDGGTTRQAITIGNEGYGAPSTPQDNSSGDKLVVWDRAGLKLAIGVSRNELWLQSTGGSICFHTAPTGAPSKTFCVDRSGNVSIPSLACPSGKTATLEVGFEGRLTRGPCK
jgi:hypothetical protein